MDTQSIELGNTIWLMNVTMWMFLHMQTDYVAELTAESFLSLNVIRSLLASFARFRIKHNS